MDRFVATRIKKGRYANASEVLRAGLRALEEDEKEDQARLKALRTAIRAGEESGIADGDVFEEVRSYIRQVAAAKGKVA
jgi:antitoxin ParD1/3/4